MKQLVSLALALGLAAPAFASGTPFVIDFEKNWDYGQAVDDSYAALGVSFTNVLGLSNGDGLGGLPDGAWYAITVARPSPEVEAEIERYIAMAAEAMRNR